MNSVAFFKLISAEHLYMAALAFAVITVIIVLMIYLFLYVKKKRFRIKVLVTGQLNEWISEALIEETLPDIAIPNSLAAYFKKEIIRQFVIDSLINIKKNVTGSVSVNIIDLYKVLGLKQDSVHKAKSLVWHKRAKGIYELYMMNQRDALPDILDYTNSTNEYVRMEAQTAIIGFSGFEGLVFLDALTQPLYEWQQIKLLEQLDAIDVGSMTHLPLWLRSDNRYVVHFSLKLAEIYQQFQVHDEVVKCLDNERDEIRYQAIKTLGSIAAEYTVEILAGQYDNETVANKKAILKQVAINGTAADIGFLSGKLKEEDDSLVLEAGRAIAAIDLKVFDGIAENAENNSVLASVVKQIKYEMAA